ncbi:MAG: DUF2750 domain-containing protein [Cytophagales bacterium]|nr:MAG: DUF2750 domain-containing protein [Cytophagales bacterium]
MSKETVDNCSENHLGFIKEIVAKQKLYGLKGSHGWAVAQSNIYEATEAYLFWQSESLAQACAKEGWINYIPTAIPLCEFLEDWCLAVFDEQNLIGIDWDFYKCGNEIESLSLAKDLLATLKESQNNELNFTKYSSLQDFENWIDKVLEEE